MGENKDKKDKKKEKSKDAAGAFESLGRQLDDIPQVRMAREAVERASEKLREAADRYRNAGQKAAENKDGEGDANLRDTVKDVLGYVRRHPAQGVIAAGMLGFFLGRLFRR